ncbi:MAG: hypothetical protein AMJ90_04680 [candidate division Zixibacteria bacterium SM23_73_2]|nr:MAG: hypothetical protein AMJ90_04680 [candidate division Zixibacteria bacterium SM23_73_2]
MNRDSDWVLVKSFKDGDQKAFNQLICKYKKEVFRLILKMIRNTEDSKDLSQEVFVKAYRKLKDFREESSFKTWLFRIAINSCINHNRKKKLRSFVSFFEIAKPLTSKDSPLKEMEKSKIQKDIDQAILKLPEKQRQVFVLRHYQNLSHSQIAEITGKTEGAVKSNYFQAVKKLKKYLSEYR